MIFEKLKSFLKQKSTTPAIIPTIAPSIQKKHRFTEFGAGLGDVVTLMYTSSRYNSLEQIAEDETVTVVLMCHNPGTKDLFRWHPNASRMKILDLGFWWPKEDVERRTFHKLPPAQPFVYQLQPSCKFYPDPNELQTLGYLKSKPYIIFSVSAGSTDRNIPDSIYEQAIDLALQAGFSAVVIGNSYSHNGRVESKVKSRPDVIDLVDCLSVPATALAIESASAVFCCHSAVCLLSWYMKRPVFLTYPKHVKDREFHSIHQYTFGKDFKTTDHMEFSEYLPERFSTFLKGLGKS